MAQKDFLYGACPNCGKELQIPGELTEFSCIYCGKRLVPQDILPQAAEETLPPEELAVLMDGLAHRLPQAVTNYLDVFKHFTKKAYPKYFESYLGCHREDFEKLAVLCSHRDTAKALAQQVLAVLDAWAEGKHSRLRAKEAPLEEAKYTLCLLTTPAILSIKQPGCELFCHALQQAWAAAYPKNTYQAVTYEQIMEGFQPRRLCYITTAVCRQAGKPDDCRELTAFRCFRDGYLAAQPHGEAKIQAYYDLAPGICMAAEFCHDPGTVYPALWKQYLAPCYEALCRGDDAACEEMYTKMVETLSETHALGHLGQ